jgi:hypothetical protein
MEGSFGLMNKRLDEQGKCDFEKRPFIQPFGFLHGQKAF